MLFHYLTIAFGLFASNVATLKLTPISDPSQWTGETNSKRELANFAGNLDLQDFESFFWGAPAGENKLIYANLTVYFPEQYRSIISMERFAGKLKSVNCAEDMMLEFIDDATFEYAKGVWNWVNSDVNRTFIMVTNYEGCADDMERLPFEVSNIRYDEEANKAFLTADRKEWQDVTHSYTLNVGHEELTPVRRMMMMERDLMPRAGDFQISLASSYDKNLFSTTVGGWTTSVDAAIRTTGSLDVDLDVDVSWFSLKSASMTVQPKDVTASVQLALSESGTLSKAYNWKKTIISIPVEGIEIAKIVKIGAFLDVDVGFTMDEWSGTAVANFGARAALSNSAVVKVDLVNSKNNKFSGWTPTFTPIPFTLSAKIEGSAKVYAEPNIKLEASAFGKGWNVGLNLQMPYIKADFAAMAASAGVCDSKKTLGVDIDAKVGVELHAQAATKGNEADPFWTQQLFKQEWPLFDKCLAFGPDNAQSGEVADPNPPASKTKSSDTPKATNTAPTEKPEPTKSDTTTNKPSTAASESSSTNKPSSSVANTSSDDKPTGSSTKGLSSTSKVDTDKSTATVSGTSKKISATGSVATSSHATNGTSVPNTRSGSEVSRKPSATGTEIGTTSTGTSKPSITGPGNGNELNPTKNGQSTASSKHSSSSSAKPSGSSSAPGYSTRAPSSYHGSSSVKPTSSPSSGYSTARPSSSSNHPGHSSSSHSAYSEITSKRPSGSTSVASSTKVVLSSSYPPIYSATSKKPSERSTTSCTSSTKVAPSSSHSTSSTKAPSSSTHSVYSTTKPSSSSKAPSSSHPVYSTKAQSSLSTVYKAPSVTTKKSSSTKHSESTSHPSSATTRKY
ncbi:hypothetical protein P280DRAFT_521094 [Massarina eburnea CBS 473.64]|uniref:Uncharacterized protein n=1 Tax=Massarina eburnea CBS 473.64 TaxID=1395130 RepID=A0A6A6RS01_9PLEO|nr:hypothetical protein P280DRAFT_521094 [Massarina eburnea CBS 473.64]